jgi:hypothetical protein
MHELYLVAKSYLPAIIRRGVQIQRRILEYTGALNYLSSSPTDWAAWVFFHKASGSHPVKLYVPFYICVEDKEIVGVDRASPNSTLKSLY